MQCNKLVLVVGICSDLDTFVNCSTGLGGGAIYSSSVYFTVDDCSFVGCNGKYGASIFALCSAVHLYHTGTWFEFV